MYIKLLITILLAFMSVTTVAEEQPKKTAVKSVELLADVTSFKPGSPLQLAVKFELNPEWHIYWRYPGKYGLPTSLELKAPDGVETSNWRFPVPEKFKQIKGADGYGYSKEVVFLADVFVPEKFTQDLSLEVNAKWLGCGNGQCVPGRKKLNLTIPFAESAKLAQQDFFKEASAKLPSTKPLASPMVSMTRHEILPRAFKVYLEWSEMPDSMQVFPWMLRGVKINEIEEKTEGLVTEYILKFRHDPDPGKLFQTKFLLSYKKDGKEFAELLTLE